MTEPSASTSGASVARGSLWQLTAFALPQLYALVSSAFVARYLGAAAVGQIALIGTVQMVVTMLVLLGFPSALARYVGELTGARRGGEARWLVGWGWRIALPGSLLGFCVLALAGTVLGAKPSSAWVLAGVSAAAAVLHTIPTAFLMGVQRWREARIIGLFTGVVSMIAKVVIVARGGGIPELFAVDAVINAVNLLGIWILARPSMRGLPAATPNPQLWRAVMRFSAIAAIGIALNLVVNQRIEVFFLAHFGSATDIARYSIPYSLISMLLWIPAALSLVFTPAVATLWGAGELSRIRAGFSRGMRLCVLVALVMLGAAVALGAPFLRLVYGGEFSDLHQVVSMLALSIPFVPLALLSTALLNGIGRLWGLTIIGIFAAAANVVLAFLLIPRFGPIGAAAANTSAQVIWAIPMLLYAQRVIGKADLRFRSLGRTVLAVALSTSFSLALTELVPLTVGVLVGSVAFLLAFVLSSIRLRALPVEDGVWFEGLVGDRFGGLPRAWSRAARPRPAVIRTGTGG